MYLPDKDHPAHDTVRAIVKDSTDAFTGDNARVFIDSGNASAPTFSLFLDSSLYLSLKIKVVALGVTMDCSPLTPPRTSPVTTGGL